MTILTATPDTANGRVRLVYTDHALSYQLYRTRLDTGEQTAVRGGWVDNIPEGLIDDYECPFGVSVRYDLGNGSDTITFDPDDKAWLSHPFDPALTLAVTVEDDNPWEWATSGGTFDVIASEWPVAVYTRRNVHRGELTLIGAWDDRADMKALVIDGAPLLLRSYPDCKVDDQWMFVEVVEREKMGGPFGERLRWRMRYQRVARPEGETVAPPANAWVAVVQTHPTWADTVAGHATWSDLLTTPHPHP